MARALVPGKALSLWLLAVGCIASLSVVLSAQVPPPKLPMQPTQPIPSANPLDEPIAWLQTARHNFTSAVKNYSCTLVKKEKNSKGIMQDEHVILFSSRVQPFSVYMKWVSPQKIAGQEVCYVDGKNRGNMRVRAKGLLVAPGFINVDPHDRRALEHSKHTILEAGLGNMIKQNLENLQVAREIGKTKVRSAEYTYDKRLCIRVETQNMERHPRFYCYRSVLYLEKDSKIPVRLENYEWPAPGGNPEGELMEMFSYVGIDFNNPTFRDDIFNK